MVLDTLRLGGGTALAATWSHRLSTETDLVCGTLAFETLRADDSAMRRLHEEGPGSGEVGEGSVACRLYRANQAFCALGQIV